MNTVAADGIIDATILRMSNQLLQDQNGTVTAIYISPDAAAPMQSVENADAIADRGLRGDRYFECAGTFSAKNEKDPLSKRGQQITFIEHEAIRAAHHQHGLDIGADQTRRNIVTRNVPLNHLVGREFTVGDVRIRGVKLCEPCGHLERLTREGTKKALLHRGGLRAEIVSDGTINVGDTIRF